MQPSRCFHPRSRAGRLRVNPHLATRLEAAEQSLPSADCPSEGRDCQVLSAFGSDALQGHPAPPPTPPHTQQQWRIQNDPSGK